MDLLEKTITNARGHQLCVRVYRPPVENRGFLLFHHGYASHTSVYDDVYRGWAAQGVTVVAHDGQGFGRSKGNEPKKHAWMDNFQHWVDDIYQVRKDVLDPMNSGGLPVFMGGQSMGGTLTTLTALRNQSCWQGIMLVSPGIDAERTLLLNVLEKLQSIALLLCPNARIVPAPPFEQCTNVPELVKQFKTDPLMDEGPMRVRTGNAFIKAFHEISAGAKQLTLPILLVGSRTDQIVSVPAMDKFLKDVQSKDVTVHWVENGFHELFLGPFQVEARNVTKDWLQMHV